MDDASNNAGHREGKPLSVWLLIIFGSLGLLIIGFYTAENWRGKRAWEKYKAVLLAKGEKLDWKDFVPPPIPDEQNILKAPIMEGWMYRTAPQTNNARPLIRIPETGMLNGLWYNGEFTELLEWKAYVQKLRRETNSSNFVESTIDHRFPNADQTVMPSIVMNEAPLPDAITNLARQAGIKIEFDPKVTAGPVNGCPAPPPKITFHWENLTAIEALLALLNNYGLELISNPETGVSLVTVSTPREVDAEVLLKNLEFNFPSEATNEIMPLIAINGAPLPDTIAHLARQAGISIQFDPRSMTRPIDPQTGVSPPPPLVTRRWTNTTSANALRNILREYRLDLERTQTKSDFLRVTPRHPRASVILEDFKEYEAEFRELYEACQRPFARYDIDYKKLLDGEYFPNFVSSRILAQSLTLHGSASLVFNDSETALQDVRSTLALSKIARSQPTLVGAMIRVAIVGLATQPVWEGLASHRWTENQLVELEKQLSSVDLMSDVASGGLGTERVYVLHAVENYSRKQLSTNYVSWWNGSLTPEEEIQRLVIRSCPRGWLFQNALVSSRSIQDTLDSMDLKSQRFSVSKLSAATNAIAKVFHPFSYFTVHFERAVTTTVRNQTGLNQAIVACALERYRLAHGEYPETLEALVPQFAEKLPHDIITGEPLKYRRESKEHFILYSIGLDEKDSGGSPAARYDGPGDWVWRYPKM